MKNMKTEPSEKTIIYRTPGDPIEITDEMLKKQEDSMLWLNKSKKKKMWHCGKVRKCEK